MQDISQIERKFREYEGKIRRLKQIERELNSLDIKGFEKEVRSIKLKIKNPSELNQVEKEFLELKQKIKGRERKREEATKIINAAKSTLQNAKGLNLFISAAENLLNESKSLFDKGEYETAILRASESKSMVEVEINKKIKQLREEAKKEVDKAYSILQKANKLGLDIKSEEKKLSDAKLKLDEKDFSNATKLANECKNSLEQKINEYLKQSIDLAYSKIKEAEKLGIDVSDAKDLHKKAILEFDNRAYERAKELAEEAKRIALERKSEYDSAFKSISEAERILNETKNKGVIISTDLLTKSKQAFDNGYYEESVRLAEELRNLVRDTEVKYGEARDRMKKAEFAIEKAKEFCYCDTSEAEELLNKARAEFEGGGIMLNLFLMLVRVKKSQGK